MPRVTFARDTATGDPARPGKPPKLLPSLKLARKRDPALMQARCIGVLSDSKCPETRLVRDKYADGSEPMLPDLHRPNWVIPPGPAYLPRCVETYRMGRALV